MNLTNFEGTPVFRAFDLVCREAAHYGVSVGSSEIVGLVPHSALTACAEYYLRLENFSPRQVLENRLSEAVSQDGQLSIEEFVAQVASPDPVPGGGSVAALAGGLGAALGEMVAGLTEGKKKFQSVEERVKKLHADLSRAREELCRLAEEDAASYKAVIDATKLPRETDVQKLAREEAIEQATRRATETPLRTARVASGVLSSLEEMARIGNPNALSDAAAGAQLAHAALKAAQYNVLINFAGLKDRAFAEACRRECDELAEQAAECLRRIDQLMMATRA
jgi:formiminotetrahydrofolate cyclodeaminase